METVEALEKYAEIFIEEFEGIYEDEYIQAEIYSLGDFIAINFVFHPERVESKIAFNKNKETAKALEQLIDKSSTSQKEIKGFWANSFYIIKQKKLKLWTETKAWSDVAMFEDTIELAELYSEDFAVGEYKIKYNVIL